MDVCAGSVLPGDWMVRGEVEGLVLRKSRELSRARGFSSSDQPDIYQELMLHLHEKTKQFDPRRGNSAAFATELLKSKCKSIYRRQNGKGYSIIRKAKSLQSGVSSPAESVQSSDVLIDSIGRRHTGQRLRSHTEAAQLRIDIEQATTRLPQSLRDMAAVLSHVSQFAAAQVLGISRRQASIIVASLREAYSARGIGA